MKAKTKKSLFQLLTLLNKIACGLAWLSLGLVIWLVAPSRWEEIYYAPFFFLLFVSLFTTSLIVNRYLSVAILIPLGIVVILGLRVFGFFQWYFPFLITGFVGTLIYFFTAEAENDNFNADNLDN